MSFFGDIKKPVIPKLVRKPRKVKSKNMAKCHKSKPNHAKGLCKKCYFKKKNQQLAIMYQAMKLKAQQPHPEQVYQSLPIESIPDLKRDDYFINQGDARKLPKLLTV